MSSPAPRLLVVAHGTASVAGHSTTERLVAAVAEARPGVVVDHCFLDVVDPRLADSLDVRPTVVVPSLLSTGYHVRTDIPDAVAGYPRTRVARHLGPHPLLTDVLLDRLGPTDARHTVLVAAGSSRSEAAVEVREAADLLAARVGHDVVTATMTDDLGALFAATPEPFQVATYLLAEGQFVDTVRAAAGSRGVVGAPLGVHPAIVQLIWLRYDEALRADEGARAVR